MLGEGVVLAASAGEQAQPLFGGGLFCAVAMPLRGARLCGGQVVCVEVFCVGVVCVGVLCVGVLCVGDGVSWFFANLHLRFGGGGLAGHLLGVSGAGGPLALRFAGRRSTGSGCHGPAGHPDPALAGSSRV